jgi:hypothetical protein
MKVEIKAPVAVDERKTATIHYLDSTHNIPVIVKGITSEELKKPSMLQFVHKRLSSIITAFDLKNEEVSECVLEIS